MRNLAIDPVRNPIEPVRNKADTDWCQRRMYTTDQSFSVIADLYPACELKYNDSISMQKKRIL